MVDSKLGRWLRAMNPQVRPAGRAEAERSARAFVFGSVIALLASIPSTVWMVQSDWMKTLMEQQYAQMGLGAAEIEMQRAMMETLWPYAIAFGGVITVVIYGALAFAQWRYMTRAIPVIMLAFAAYTLVAGVGMRVIGMAPEGPLFPLWISVLTWAAFAIQTVIYIASLQGAMMLHRMKQENRG